MAAVACGTPPLIEMRQLCGWTVRSTRLSCRRLTCILASRCSQPQLLELSLISLEQVKPLEVVRPQPASLLDSPRQVGFRPGPRRHAVVVLYSLTWLSSPECPPWKPVVTIVIDRAVRNLEFSQSYPSWDKGPEEQI